MGSGRRARLRRLPPQQAPQELPRSLAPTGTHLDGSPLPHGPQIAATEIGHHEGQGDLVILEL